MCEACYVRLKTRYALRVLTHGKLQMTPDLDLSAASSNSQYESTCSYVALF